MIFILLASLLVITLLILNRYGFDYASPSLQFFLGWDLCVFIACLYYKEWGLNTLSFGTFFLIFGGALISFLAEELYRNSKKTHKISIYRNGQKLCSSVVYRPELWKLVVFVIFQIIVYYLVSQRQMAFTSESTLADAIGEIDQLKKFGNEELKLPPLLNISNQICQFSGYIWSALLPFYVKQGKGYRKYALGCGVNLITTIIGSGLSGGRMPAYGYIIASFITYMLTTKDNDKMKKVTFDTKRIFAIMAIVLFGYFFSQIGVLIGRDKSILDDSKYMFAMYCGAQVKNLDDVVTYSYYKESELPLGRTFSGFYKNINDRLHLGIVDTKQTQGFNSYHQYILGNVYSCYKPYYSDLGYFGVIFVFFMIYLMCFLRDKFQSSAMFITGKLNLFYCWYAYLCMGLSLSFFAEVFFARFNIESFIRYNIYWFVIIWFLQGVGNTKSWIVKKNAPKKLIQK